MTIFVTPMPVPLELEYNLQWPGLKRRKLKQEFSYLKRNHQLTQLLLEAPLQSIEPQPTVQIEPQPTVKSIQSHTPVPRKPLIPSVDFPSLIGFVHFVFNLVSVSVLVYFILYLFYFTKLDISHKISQRKEETRVLIEEARRQYKLNKCDPETRVPGMEAQCGQWECTITDGLTGLKYLRIVSEMFADVLDGFVSKFSYKTLFTLLVMTVVFLVFRRR